MRVQPWIAPVLGVCLLLASAGNVVAQYPGAAPGYAGGPPPTTAYDAAVPGGVWAPPGYEDLGMPGAFGPYGMVDQGHVVPYNSAIATQPPGPPGALPWPHITPFENRFSETYNREGLWFNDVDNSPRKYFFNINYMRPYLRRPTRRKIGEVVLSTSELIPLPGTFTTERGFYGGNNGEAVFHHDFKTNGIRSQWGYTDPDQSGFQADAWWASDVSVTFDTTLIRPPGLATPFAPAPPAIGVIERDGTRNILIYDTQFRLNYTSEAFGTSAQWLWTPIRKREHYQIQPLAGVRYINIQEGFGFIGRDSLLFPNRDYYAFFNSFVDSHLFGPEIGLKYQLGGKKFFTVKGETKFGLMYNYGTANLEGEGFGTPTALLVDSYPFDFKERSGHISPTFEQAVVMEFRIFGIIPVLKRMSVLDDAVLRIGYNYLNVGEVERPADIINYDSAPATPTIQHRRSKWDMGAWTFGIDWKY